MAASSLASLASLAKSRAVRGFGDLGAKYAPENRPPTFEGLADESNNYGDLRMEPLTQSRTDLSPAASSSSRKNGAPTKTMGLRDDTRSPSRSIPEIEIRQQMPASGPLATL